MEGFMLFEQENIHENGGEGVIEIVEAKHPSQGFFPRGQGALHAHVAVHETVNMGKNEFHGFSLI